MKTPRWPVVIFDLDGTVANTIPLILASYTHAVQDVLGHAVAPEQGRRWIGRTLIDTFTELDGACADDLVATYTEWNLANLERLIEPYEGMDELLADLTAAGVRIGIATSKRRFSA
ncbi:MAG: HAD hydrolase-like protein, partial [Micropruina sp.]